MTAFSRADPFRCSRRPAQKRLRDLKARISAQSKKNFVLERDVRYLDSRIALLIQNVSTFAPDPDRRARAQTDR